MTYCTECNSVEPRTRQLELDGEEITICAECDCEEDTLKRFDEDWGTDR